MDELLEKSDPVELDYPDGVADVRQAVELLRAWVGDGDLLVSLNTDAFGPRVDDWGRLLAEIGHHVARAAALRGDLSGQDALAAIAKGFDERLRNQGETRTGRQRGRVTN